MKELLPLRGVITVLNTPFTEEDAVDLPSLRRNVAYALDAGVAGFLVPALASEVGKLSEDERTALVSAVVETVAGRVPVIGGGMAADDAERLRIARTLIDLGCSGILANIPLTNGDEDAYRRRIDALDALQPGFLMIQDWDFGGYGLPLPLIVRIFEEVASFRCLKIETVPAGVKYSEVLQATGGHLHVSGGWAVGQMLEGLQRGVHAFMPTGMHRSYVRILQSWDNGYPEEADLFFRQLLPILAFSNQHLDVSIHFFKRLLHAQGIYSTPRVRQPILPFDDIHEHIAQGHIRKVKHLEGALHYE